MLIREGQLEIVPENLRPELRLIVIEALCVWFARQKTALPDHIEFEVEFPADNTGIKVLSWRRAL
jgi:hypothetical protein